MKKVDHITIKIGKKPFGKYKVVSERAFENDYVALISFDGQEFIWIPTWKEIGAIVEVLYFVENFNRVNSSRPILSFIQHLKKMRMDIDLGDIK